MCGAPSDLDQQFELPLEQASRLLEESDFQDVVNKMPFEVLDLFGNYNLSKLIIINVYIILTNIKISYFVKWLDVRE